MKALLVFALSAKLSWVAVTTGPAVTGYSVFRGDSCTALSPTPLNPSPVALPSFDDTTVVAGRTYCYVVRSVGDNGILSPTSTPVVFTVPSDPCVVKPAATTVVRWSGSKTGKFVKQVLTDDRGCTVTVTRP